MSALGQKRTLEKVRLMSALPPIADTGPRYVRRNSSGSLAIFAAIRRAELKARWRVGGVQDF